MQKNKKEKQEMAERLDTVTHTHTHTHTSIFIKG